MDQSYYLQQIAAHRPFDDTEAAHQSAMHTFIKQHPDFFRRTLTIGHVTGSAWIITPARSHALLLHHRKLDRWLQPGGHIEQESDVLTSALREAREETGIDNLRVLDHTLFDLDIHTIPANHKEAEHQHYDIRYIFEADFDATPAASDESNDVRWFRLDEIAAMNNDPSIRRMVEKSANYVNRP